ncbi:MAG: VWA domain-containing protein [Spirochaetes bacterium]|nr:VWA domain-containing protein [Spirochaetota bacterium]
MTFPIALPADFRFESPMLLWALLAVPAYMALRLVFLRRRAVAIPTLQFFPHPWWRRLAGHAGWILESAILTTLILALAGPGRERTHTLLDESGIDVAFALDVSATMQAADFSPNRLEALKSLTRDFIRRSAGNRVALYVFAKYVFTQTPLTTDRETALELVEGIAYESVSHSQSGGTAIGDALVAAANGLAKVRLPGRGQLIILITDGENIAGIDPELAGKYVKSLGLRCYLLGMAGEAEIAVFEPNGKPFIGSEGKPLRTRLDDAQLRRIAKAADGVYARAQNGDALEALLREIERMERSPLERATARSLDSWRPTLAAAAAALLCCWLVLEGMFLRRPLR